MDKELILLKLFSSRKFYVILNSLDVTKQFKTSFNQFLIEQLFAVSITVNAGQNYVKSIV